MLLNNSKKAIQRKQDKMLDRSILNTFGPLANKNRKSKRYLLLLFLTKLLQCFAYFYYYDILKGANFIQLLFLSKLMSSIVFVVIHKPISHGRKLARKDFKKLLLHSSLTIFLNLSFMEGLAICGPVRTILLSCHSDTTIVGVLNFIFHQSGDSVASVTRGTGYYGLGLFCLFFFDQDVSKVTQEPSEELISKHIYHHTVDIFSWLGLPDHKGGIFLLLAMSVGNMLVNSYGSHVASTLNGPNRMRALSSCFECILLVPFFLASLFLSSSSSFSSLFQYEVLFVIFILFILNVYTEILCTEHLQKYFTHRAGTVALFMFALVVGFIWEHFYDITYRHKISSGVIFATISFIFATTTMVQPPSVRPRGALIGYTTSGEPLYNINTLTSKSFPLKHYIRLVISSPESRSIFFYLCLNLFFTAVELVYGIWTNSLGLISDGFHMLFDCSALVLGLWAAIAAKWPPTKIFSFGYGRIEVLSGFVNGLFLVVIAFAVFLTALQRIIDPPHVHTENLLTVSVIGLLVNLVGIFAFSHAHSHGGKKCDHGHNDEHNHSHEDHGHSHSHGHQHSHNDHGHSHHDKSHEKAGNANMEGVFLHVLADTLGSVGVIISTLLIQYYGWNIADPICSIFIAVLIISSVIPLLKSSAFVLLQKAPKEVENDMSEALVCIKQLPDVVSCRQLHLWQHTPDVLHGSLIVQINVEASEHNIRQRVFSLLKEKNVSQVSVQVEKQSFYEHMSKVTTGYYTEIILPRKSEHINDVAIRIKDI